MMLRKQKISVQYAWGALIVQLILVAASDSPLATPISPPMYGGEVSMGFLGPPMPNRPWEVLIVAKRLAPTDYGQIIINEGVREEVLFEGAVSAGDSIARRASFPPPPPGLYGIRATYTTCPGCTGKVKAATIVVNVLVREDTVFWGGEIMRAELDYDLRQRGLEEVDPKQLDSLAPDLAERWRKVKGWRGIGPPPNPRKSAQGPPPTVYQPERMSTSEGRDTIAFPGWGPPPYKPTPDSVKARFFHRGANPRLEPPPPPFVKPEDTEFGRSEEAARLRESRRQFFDTMGTWRDTLSDPNRNKEDD